MFNLKQSYFKKARNLVLCVKQFINFLRGNRLQNWKKLNKQIINFKNKNKEKKKILIATSAGGLRSSLVLESLIGSTLNFKGCDVEFLLCDGILPTCIMGSIHSIDENEYNKNGSKFLCDSCFEVSNNYLKKLNLNINKFSNFINDSEIKQVDNLKLDKLSFLEIKKYKYKNVSVGEHAYAGALRYYAKTEISEEKHSKNILNLYLRAALFTFIAIENLFKHKQFDEVILNHGIYVPQGIINEYARIKKINVSTWCTGYRRNSFCFTRGDTYHRSLINEPNSNWENIQINENIISKIKFYLNSRLKGSKDWIFFHKNPSFDSKKFFKENKIDPNKQIIGLATNVLWDAQIDYPSNFFSGMMEWVYFTIDHFKKNQNIQLLVRVHPAEVNETKPSRQKVVEEILKKYGKLPPNIILIPPENNISTYSIFEKCSSVIIYGTKMGIELSAMKKLVIVCGEAFIRNKKLGIDVENIDQYKEILNKIENLNYLTFNLDELRSIKYAYHFFFRRTVEFSSIKERKGKWPNFEVDKNYSKNLLNKSDLGLEMVCDSIISGKDFIFEDEKQF